MKNETEQTPLMSEEGDERMKERALRKKRRQKTEGEKVKDGACMGV
jgi:hypothetical protein